MTAAVACVRPDCSGGTIEDGYCDNCGLTPLAPVDPAVGPATSAATRATAATGSAAATGATGTGGSRASRRGTSRSSSTASTRSRLGAGMVDVPPVPRVDPATALLADPRVAEHKRFCSTCGKPVGRSREGRPGRAEGFCPEDGTRYSFVPKLTPGTLVAGQYDVQGCLAHGGLGWIYLALDRKVEDRWVVLKGLLDAGNADAKAAAVAEKRFLAQVSHPNIVTIHNFVEHPGDDGEPIGYIVMEYVGGSSLKQLVEARGPGIQPLPVGQAIAYALEMLPALGYLHSLGLAYCDFKPDNVIQYDRQVKLIDMGAVIRIDDLRSAVYGTVGYQAPEIATAGPSAVSDLFTVGRTLAVLALGIVPARRGAVTPIPAEHPVLAAHESFHRLLLRATDPDPMRRFATADEMADQLTGVLREVLSADDGVARPGRSLEFGPPRGTFGAGLLGSEAHLVGRPDPRRVAALLPVPLVDPADPAAGVLATASAGDPQEVLRLAADAPDQTLELRLRVIRAHLEAGDADAAAEAIVALAADEPGDWRLDWYRGIAALVAGHAAAAGPSFDTVLATLPGEAAPKLALAATAEAAGLDEPAGRFYRQVGRPDPTIADAAFGAARVALRAGRAAEAIAALDTVPESSSQYVAAQLAAVRAVVRGADPTEPDLRAAAARIEKLPLDPATDHDIRATVLTSALAHAPAGDAAGGPPLLGSPWSERGVRLALEERLRAAARLVTDGGRRLELVDRANAVRPRTWV